MGEGERATSAVDKDRTATGLHPSVPSLSSYETHCARTHTLLHPSHNNILPLYSRRKHCYYIDVQYENRKHLSRSHSRSKLSIFKPSRSILSFVVTSQMVLLHLQWPQYWAEAMKEHHVYNRPVPNRKRLILRNAFTPQ